jgi:hypothetical protein
VAVVIVHVHTVNPLNRREHWAARAKRAREARQATFYSLKAAKAPHSLPCVVTVTRVAPRALDGHDGLPASLKGVVDGVTDYLLVKSDADPRIEWKYAQRQGGVREYAAEVEIAPKGEA